MKNLRYISKSLFSTLARKAGRLSLLLCLMMVSVGAWATDYVFVYNGNYLGVNAAGNAIQNYTTFDPTYCIWTCDGDLDGTSRALYIKVGTSTRYLNATTTNGGAPTLSNAAQNVWSADGNFITYNNAYYLYYRDGWKTSNQGSPGYGQRNNNTYYRGYGLTNAARTDYRSTTTASSTTTDDQTTPPTISYNSYNGTTITLSRTNLIGTYSTATTIVVGGTTYYKGSNGAYSTTAPSSTLNPTYTWSVTSGNASITQDGVVTPNNGNTTNIVVRVTATNTNPSLTKTSADYTINVSPTAAATSYTGGLNAVNPASANVTYNNNTAITLDSPARKKNSTPAYQTYTASGNTFYRVNNTFQAAAPTASATDVAVNSYSWALSGAGASNAQLASATGATNTLTYNSAAASDVTVTISVTANYAEGGNISKSANVTLMQGICATPTLRQDGTDVTLSCSYPATGVTIYYTTDGSEPSVTNGTGVASGTTISTAYNTTIKAIATAPNYDPSPIATLLVSERPTGSGTQADPYILTSSTHLNNFADMVNAGGANAAAFYKVEADIPAAGYTTPTGTFSGTFDGGYFTISGLTTPLFSSLNNAQVKNVIVDNVSINATGNVGAIANTASGNTRIYNCGVLATNTNFTDVFDKSFVSSSSVQGTVAVGSIVGEISGNTRVANCYSYADVSGGTYAAGIVGRYNGTWISQAAQTTNGTNMFVMNNMFYGDVISGTNRSPIVGGNSISGNYSTWSYFRYKSITNTNFTQQNGAMAAQEDMWLKRFNFFQSAVTNHRDMAAVYIFNNASRIDEIAQWYIDESIAPWPILRKAEAQKSILNRTIPNTGRANEGNLITNGKTLIDSNDGTTILDPDVTQRYNMNVGKNGMLRVNFSISGTGVASGGQTYSIDLPITDMDYAHFDFTWGKVVLPFANEFDGWTPDYAYICTGWEISSVTGGTTGTLTDYNFADRNCTAKDIYHATNNPIIFAQGGNWIVPYGVTEVNMKAHFARAYYLADANYDCQGNGSNAFGGARPTTYHGRQVYTTVQAAWGAMENKTLPHDQALVLVGNYHYSSNQSGSYTAKGCTIMSIDEDRDQQPDFGWYNSNGNYRANWMPMRWDFIALYGFNMVQTNTAPPGIAIPTGRGWLEFTETTICRTYEFEANDGMRTSADNAHSLNAWIINGGYFQQMVRCYSESGWNNFNNQDQTKLSYMKVGGNTYVKEFFHGNHSNTSLKYTLRPIIVTGGEIEQCFLTGMGNKNEIITTNNNVRFYCAGGKIDKYLSVYNGYPVVDATMKVDHARIGRFFGGGTSPKAQLSGNINITMDNSHVDFFCGGPEFGDMGTGKTVIVSTKGTIFGEYYGAGFGGTALTRITNGDGQKTPFSVNGRGRLNYNSGEGGFEVSYEMEALLNGAGESLWRYYDYRADLSMATTGNVTTTAEDCLFLTNFYGGGCQGKVNGTINSTLTNCDVVGSAFGGGYKAAATTINVYPAGGNVWQVWDATYKAYSNPVYPTPVVFTWANGTNGTSSETNRRLYTNADMTQMGRVTQAIAITIDGGTVRQNVFGGGNESPSNAATTVTITGGASVAQDVYGGANQADVGGNTLVDVLSGTVSNVFGANNISGTKVGSVTVNINQAANQTVLVSENVYGGGNQADYTGNPVVNIKNGTVNGSVFGGGLSANVTGNTTVAVTGGTVNTAVYGGGALANVTGNTNVNLFGGSVKDAFGGGLGRQAVAADPEHGIAAVAGIAAEVGGNTTITLGNPANLAQTSVVTGSIFGANNLNGTPLGHALVRVCSTKTKGGDDEEYHVPAVYGGGNMSPYEPTSASDFAEVIIENCDNSIEYVYGGGNAAPVPATKVTIWGANAIGNVFGGGNGAGEIAPEVPNPGANVGYKTDNTTAYGPGTAEVNIYGGTIHNVFGGSNTKGLIRVSADVNLDEKAQPGKDQCPLILDEVYGAGNEAEMYGAAGLNLGCITGLSTVYGGAKNADFHGDVVLNITSGTFGKIFGGNNLGGTLDGAITINIDETGCHPVIIDQLYACGNLADYATPVGKSEPTINVISCTRIGSIFGAGLGDLTGLEEKATVTGNPIININQIPGIYAANIDADGNGVADGDATRLGTIGTVFGGGNAAKVVGSTYVNVGTLAKNAHIQNAAGTIDTTPTAAGANILGNIYGGGNQADVTGKTNVTIGQ